MADLSRFLVAQDGVYPRALDELRAGAKQSHWMWFIFPQLRGLGRSPTALRYGIADLTEARAYLADPVLGARLREAMAAMLLHPDRSAEAILGPVDAIKLRSSATLFAAAGGGAPFAEVLATFYDGQACPLTRELLADGGANV
ncbi:DUF1810 domain-containing protein [Pseudodonghicola flavimaris]|uniref:DUF1810 domain-containing protein n=1 Tax=Pseudodonghicola flavimaris TaxID=3050036 RepID=A0ABT7F0E1_9RHOB|nr:DUF1810 domain-containing protein [Pseudodonghicola flavimaris]MDK3018076.1 DUF1810 domain-containing protein [Pseudodonghicola flavimaris]